MTSRLDTTNFTPAEHQHIGHQLAGFHTHCCELNRLLSRAYPVRHPICTACYSAVEDGLFAFRCNLEILAHHDHPAIDLHYAFHPNGQEDYRQPPNLPGCTDPETRQLAESLHRRSLKREKDPLTAQELAIVVRCYHHINETVTAILDRVQVDRKKLGDITALSLTAEIIRNALTALQREEQRVNHG